ncbi:MAG: hypothetical protein WAX69_15965 [Victivallales bacterium]
MMNPPELLRTIIKKILSTVEVQSSAFVSSYPSNFIAGKRLCRIIIDLYLAQKRMDVENKISNLGQECPSYSGRTCLAALTTSIFKIESKFPAQQKIWGVFAQPIKKAGGFRGPPAENSFNEEI